MHGEGNVAQRALLAIALGEAFDLHQHWSGCARRRHRTHLIPTHKHREADDVSLAVGLIRTQRDRNRSRGVLQNDVARRGPLGGLGPTRAEARFDVVQEIAARLVHLLGGIHLRGIAGVGRGAVEGAVFPSGQHQLRIPKIAWPRPSRDRSKSLLGHRQIDDPAQIETVGRGRRARTLRERRCRQTRQRKSQYGKFFHRGSLRRQQARVLLGPFRFRPSAPVQPADRLFLLATLHAYVVFSLAGFPSIVFHAGLLLFPTLLTAIRLLSLRCGSDAAQTEQNEDNHCGIFHDDLLSMLATTWSTSCAWFASRSLALLLAVRSKLLQVGPQVCDFLLVIDGQNHLCPRYLLLRVL